MSMCDVCPVILSLVRFLALTPIAFSGVFYPESEKDEKNLLPLWKKCRQEPIIL